jgi:hypothetical protein
MSVKWRMVERCSNCPFAESGEGLRERESLRPGRMEEIFEELGKGSYFVCHKTICADGVCESDGRVEGNVKAIVAAGHLYCAGALQWQRERGIEPEYARICRRLFGE